MPDQNYHNQHVQTSLARLADAADTLQMYAQLIETEARGITESARRLQDRHVNPDDCANPDPAPGYDALTGELEYLCRGDVQRVLDKVRAIYSGL